MVVIIRVNVASINPIVLRTMEGYDSKLLNIRRQAENFEEFPLITEVIFLDFLVRVSARMDFFCRVKIFHRSSQIVFIQQRSTGK